MKTSTRRAVAHIAGSLISGHTTATIYDYQDKRHVNMSGDVKTGGVAVYDYEQRCHITGSGGSLYHHGNRAHITLQLNGARACPVDHVTGSRSQIRIEATSTVAWYMKSRLS